MAANKSNHVAVSSFNGFEDNQRGLNETPPEPSTAGRSNELAEASVSSSSSEELNTTEQISVETNHQGNRHFNNNCFQNVNSNKFYPFAVPVGYSNTFMQDKNYMLGNVPRRTMHNVYIHNTPFAPNGHLYFSQVIPMPHPYFLLPHSFYDLSNVRYWAGWTQPTARFNDAFVGRRRHENLGFNELFDQNQRNNCHLRECGISPRNSENAGGARSNLFYNSRMRQGNSAPIPASNLQRNIEHQQNLATENAAERSIKEQLTITLIGQPNVGKSAINSWITSEGVSRRSADIEGTDVNRTQFETDKKNYTVLDIPGRCIDVPDLLRGLTQTDVAVLVVSVSKTDNEPDSERLTRQYVILARNASIEYLVVLVNKMDDPDVKWNQSKFCECQEKIMSILVKLCHAFTSSTVVTFIPTSGETGQGIVSQLLGPSWYSGSSLFKFIEDMPGINRKVQLPFLLSIAAKHNNDGTTFMGKIENGTTNQGAMLALMPNKKLVTVEQIWSCGVKVKSARAGDNVMIKLGKVLDHHVSPGFVLCGLGSPISTSDTIELKIGLLDKYTIITEGCTAIMHLHGVAEMILVLDVICLIVKEMEGPVRVKVPYLRNKEIGIVRIKCPKLVCSETYKNNRNFGRCMLRNNNVTIAVGRVLRQIN